jgi:primosomal protein N' (replication factor Y)
MIVEVLVPLPFDHSFSYSASLDLGVSIGSIVRVPFGRRSVDGLVVSLEGKDVKGLKPIYSIAHKCVLPKRLVDWVLWVADYCLIPKGTVLKTLWGGPLIPQLATQNLIVLNDSFISNKTTSTQKKVLDCLTAHAKPLLRKEIRQRLGVSEGVIAGLINKGMLKVIFAPAQSKAMDPLPAIIPTLSAEQESAGQLLINEMHAEHPCVTLLDGVTGSGKTEVYFDVIDKCLANKGQILVMLPEIALTAQWLQRFQKRFGFKPLLWHSNVSKAQKARIWHAVLDGDPCVVVGARSSLFLPFQNLKLIVVDEEHDGSFKQEEGMIYHARDMAIVRSKLCQAFVILSTATPSLETWSNIQNGRYKHVKLPERFNVKVGPQIQLVDMRKHDAWGTWISKPLREALVRTFKQGAQSMLYINRRGYAPVTLCRACGYRFACPDCSAWLVRHKYNDTLQCHHCGYHSAVSSQCPSCQVEDSTISCGPGVERIEEEVLSFIPDARVMVLSSDHMSQDNQMQAVIEKIEAGGVDMIIGTQVMAKGHDFKNLTCVGVIDGDLGLMGSDLRASERTFQMLTQVAGRSGRHVEHGEVWLQTYQPESDIMKALSRGDRDAFFGHELALRQESGWPPFGRLAGLIVSGGDEAKVAAFVKAMRAKAPQLAGIRLLGPAQAPLYKVRRKYRWRFTILAPKETSPHSLVNAWLPQIKCPRDIHIQVDMDPISFY